jgi:hypothetical protein
MRGVAGYIWQNAGIHQRSGALVDSVLTKMRSLAHLRVLTGRTHRGESLLQIGNQIVRILNSHRQPDQLLGHAHLLPLLG